MGGTQDPAMPLASQPFNAETPVSSEETRSPAPEKSIVWHEGHFRADKPIYYQLQELGMEPAKVHDLIDLLTPVYDFRKSRREHRWRLGIQNAQPTYFTLHVSRVEIYDVTVLNDRPVLTTREVPTFTHWQVFRGEMGDSLFQSLAHAPQGHRLALKLAAVFAWDIDFYKDPRRGDTFDVLVETEYIQSGEESLFQGFGRILAARYRTRTKGFQAYHFQPEKGKTGYFNHEGQSLVRAFLRSPLKLRGVSSRFQKSRFHPILKKYRPHNGVDYRANKNTPVMAVADGKVVTAGRYGGAGIAVELQHERRMLTQYFHLNAIAKGVRRGRRVKQGQVIGYVGKTGLATSYHLHFGMKINGRYVDPLKQKFEPGKPISPDHKDAFGAWVRAYLAYLDPDPLRPEGAPIVRLPALWPPKPGGGQPGEVRL